jgi:hypothetical protein
MDNIEKVNVDLFDNDELNEITGIIYQFDEEYREKMNEITEKMYEAFYTKWGLGEQLWVYENVIFDEFETWAEYAKEIGKNPSQLSRAKRGYEHLREQGAETWEEVVEILKTKEIKPTAKNFEGIGRLLNEPEEKGSVDYNDRVSRDMNRLNEISDEAEEILARNENMNMNQPLADKELPSMAEDTVKFLGELVDKLKRQDVYNVPFDSEAYLEFIRGFGKDLITGEPCERCDPHHAHPSNTTGNYGEKLPDWSAIPVARDTHNKITSGELELSPEKILRAQVKCLVIFLMARL